MNKFQAELNTLLAEQAAFVPTPAPKKGRGTNFAYERDQRTVKYYETSIATLRATIRMVAEAQQLINDGHAETDCVQIKARLSYDDNESILTAPIPFAPGAGSRGFLLLGNIACQ